MKIDISTLLKVDGSSLGVTFNENMEGLESFANEVVFDGPVSFKGKITNLNGILNLKGLINASYVTKCARCLSSVVSDFAINVEEDIIFSKELSEDIQYVYDGPNLNIDKIIIDTILLSIPIKELCEEGCKGICATCGANRNTNTCNCEQVVFDDRFATLKDFFKK